MKCIVKRTFLLIFSIIYLSYVPSYSSEGNQIIEDFKDNPHMRWQFYTDQVMGGVSVGRAVIKLDSEGPYLRLEGSVSTANNGGFIQVRTYVNNIPKSAQGIILKVRGNGERYYMHLNTIETISLPQQYRFYYQADFPTYKEWHEVRLPFSSAFKRSKSQMSKKINGNKIRTIGLLGYGKEHNALLEIKYLSFY